MRFYGVFFLLCCCGLASAQGFYYGLTAKASGLPLCDTLFVTYEAGGQQYADTFRITTGSNTFRHALPQPVAAVLRSNNPAVGKVAIFLANNQLTAIVANGRLTVGDRSGLQQPYRQLTKNDRVRPQYFPLYGKLTANNDTAGLNRLGLVFDSLQQDDVLLAANYLNKPRQPLLLLLAFMRYASFTGADTGAQRYFKQLPRWAQQSPDGQNMALKMEAGQRVRVGAAAPLWQSSDLQGRPFDLQQYRGRYVLLDFWASWCGPCRKEHPGLKALNEQYGGERFAVISVSLDEDRNSWAAAVAKDGLSWLQVGDGKGFQSQAAVLYGVQAIPANFLIDGEGRIIAKNSSWEEVVAVLQKNSVK
jgi:thiol-disulfide isomerase/thioredoxin